MISSTGQTLEGTEQTPEFETEGHFGYILEFKSSIVVAA